MPTDPAIKPALIDAAVVDLKVPPSQGRVSTWTVKHIANSALPSSK